MTEIATFLSVEQAAERILSVFEPLEAIEAPLDRSLGMVLAADIVAPHDVPLTDNSAFDGYALRAADIATASEQSPVRLQVVYDLQAGRRRRRAGRSRSGCKDHDRCARAGRGRYGGRFRIDRP